MRRRLYPLPLVGALLALAPLLPAQAQVQFSIGLYTPGVSIGLQVPSYPQLVRVPGVPVYYAPRFDANYFFYDGLYWVFQDEEWYASSWYDGPWQRVHDDDVPLYLLRVPVRYYRRPPPYFSGWRLEAPPRWDAFWGDDWARRHRGWDRWDRNRMPPPAPLPLYQRHFGGERYPQAIDRQQQLFNDNYRGRYRPREPVTQQVVPPPQRGGQPRPFESQPDRRPDHRSDHRPDRPPDRPPDRQSGRPFDRPSERPPEQPSDRHLDRQPGSRPGPPRHEPRPAAQQPDPRSDGRQGAPPPGPPRGQGGWPEGRPGGHPGTPPGRDEDKDRGRGGRGERGER